MNPFRCPISVRGHRFLASTLAGLGALALGSTAPVSSLHAQATGEAVSTLSELIVSANRAPTDPAAVTSVVTVVKPDDLHRAQVDSLGAALATVPGLSVVQTGAHGGQTAVFMRGGGADHTLFFVDGVRMNTADASYANALGAAPTVGLDRIEVLRGSQSTLYGSSALGGVIVLDTTHGRQAGPAGRGSVTAGSFATVEGALELQGATDQLGYSLALSAGSSDNQRAYDDYRHVGYATRLESQLNPALTVGLTWRGQDVSAGAPGGLGSTYVGATAFRENLSTAYVQWQADESLSSRLTYGWVQQQYAYTPEPPPVGNAWDTDYTSRDTRNVVDWQINCDPSATVSLVGGATFETEGSVSAAPGSHDVYANDSRGLYLLTTAQLAAGTTLNAGVRYDDFDRWGEATTWRVGGAQVFAGTGTKLRLNYGTGFAAPRPAYVVGGPFYNPNPALQPEESRGWDVGVDQTLAAGRIVAGLTYFENRFRNLFTYDWMIPGIINTGRAASQGVETSLLLTPRAGLALQLGYTYLDARDEASGQPLIRRPRHLASARLTWQATDAWLLGAGVSFAGDRFDGSTAAPVAMPDYTVVRLFTHYDVSAALRLKLRIENAFDADYEVVRNYPALPLAIYGGADWRF